MSALSAANAWLRRLARKPQQGPLWQEAKIVADDPDKRVLWLVGNPALARQMLLLAGGRRAETTILVSTPAIGSALQDLAKGSVICAAFETAPLAADYDLCIVCPAPEQMPDLFEEWLDGPIARALKPGGAAILPIPRDASDETLAQLQTREEAGASLRAFSEFHFAGDILAADMASRFGSDSPFAFEILAQNETDQPFLWFRLVKRSAAPQRPKAVFPRSPQPNRFPMKDFRTFAGRLEAKNVQAMRTTEFAKRFASVTAKSKSGKGFGILKFDIHRGIRRAEEMARILTRKSLPGLFLMMHRHDANAAFYDHEETWNILREIQSMGHEIGLHLDPFDLVRRHGDLMAATAQAADEFRSKGLSIEAATLHGDTRASIRSHGLRALDFFQEGAHVSRWDGVPPEGDEALAAHFARYTLGELREKTGIRFLVETTFGNDGAMIAPFVPLYISDNTRTLQTSGPRRTRIRGERPFRVSPSVARFMAKRMREEPFLALFHPQWYW